MVQNIIQDLLKDFDPESDEIDVVQDFANAMPVLVIANWLGMPAEDREFIRTLSRQLLSLDQESPDRHTRVHEGYHHAERLRQPAGRNSRERAIG